MSVINTTLQELEQQSPAAVLNQATATPRAVTRARFTWLIWILLPTLGALFMMLWYQWQEEPQRPELSTPEPVAETSKLEVTAPTLPKVNQLTGLQVQQQGDEYRLEFRLQREPVFFLQKQEGLQQVFRLRDVESQVPVPQLQANTWLTRLRMQQQAKDLLVVLTLTANTELEAVSEQQEQYIWRLILRHNAAKLPASVSVEAPKPMAKQEQKSSSQAINQKETPETETAKQAPAKAQVKSVATIPSPDQAEPEAPVTQATVAPVSTKIQINTTDRREQLRKARQSALQRLNNGQVASGLQQFRQLLQQQEADLTATILADWYAQQGQQQQSLNLLGNVLRQYPESATLRIAYARLLVTEGQNSQAIEVLSTLSQPHHEALAILGNVYQRQAQYADAIDAYRASLQLNPQQVRTLAALGLSLEAAGQSNEAKAVYQKALAMTGLGQGLRQLLQQRVELLR